MKITIPDVPVEWPLLILVSFFVLAGFNRGRPDRRGETMPPWEPMRLDCPYSVPGSLFDQPVGVTRVCHMPDDHFVMVSVDGQNLAYCDVPTDVGEQFLAAADKNDFFNQNIRDDATGGRFTCAGKKMPRYP